MCFIRTMTLSIIFFAITKKMHIIRFNLKSRPFSWNNFPGGILYDFLKNRMLLQFQFYFFGDTASSRDILCVSSFQMKINPLLMWKLHILVLKTSKTSTLNILWSKNTLIIRNETQRVSFSFGCCSFLTYLSELSSSSNV